MGKEDFIIKDGVLTKYNGAGGYVVIPASVTSIGDAAFEDCRGLTSVTIGGSVTSIGDEAFRDCSGLTSITLPASVTSIGAEVFTRSGLTSIEIVGEWALTGCTGITSITYMGTMAEWLAIGKHDDWDYCSGEYVVHCTDGDIGYADELKAYTGTGGDVVIPSGVTSIAQWAFADRTDLTSVQIPSSVIIIGEGAFNSCIGLTSITYTGTMAEWRDFDKEDDWDLDTGDYVIHCTDGDIAKGE